MIENLNCLAKLYLSKNEFDFFSIHFYKDKYNIEKFLNNILLYGHLARIVPESDLIQTSERTITHEA